MSEPVRTRRPNVTDLIWRAVYRLGFPLARTWWRLRSPRHEGALVAVRVGPAVLVVRASYRTEWNLPGGGVHRGETPRMAARREVEEEIGLTEVALRPAGRWEGIYDGRRDRVHFFEVHLAQLPPLRLDNREIVEARWLDLEEVNRLPLTAPAAACLAPLRADRGHPWAGVDPTG